ncbi:MAG: hypothetical protein RL077_5569 [Verrucomicrobiota bacterium]
MESRPPSLRKNGLRFQEIVRCRTPGALGKGGRGVVQQLREEMAVRVVFLAVRVVLLAARDGRMVGVRTLDSVFRQGSSVSRIRQWIVKREGALAWMRRAVCYGFAMLFLESGWGRCGGREASRRSCARTP